MNSEGNSRAGSAAGWAVTAVTCVAIIAICIFLIRSSAREERAAGPTRAVAEPAPEAVPPAPPDPTPTVAAPTAVAAPDADRRAESSPEAKTLAPSQRRVLADFDSRKQAPELAAPARLSAVEKLGRTVPGLDVQFDELTGGPKNIVATGRFLSAGGGGDAEAVVRGFIAANAEIFGHSGEVLGAARVTRKDVTAHNGMTTLVWQQELDGIPLFQTILRANVTKTGELITIGSQFLRDPAAAARAGAPQRAAKIANPTVTAPKAVALAAADIGAAVDERAVTAAAPAEGAERKQSYRAPKLSDTTTQLSWVPLSADALRLAWDVTTMSTARGEMFRVLVDAETGAVLVRQGLTNYVSDATYRVYASATTRKPFDSPAPMLPGTPTPNGAQGVEVPRQSITLQSQNPTASPLGWINDGVTETLGNNVDAHTDTDANNVADLPRPTSATRVFDFPMDLTQAPSTYKEASVTQLFYLNNWMHDQLYALGFTESAGNFQTNNFGRGGNGNDAVQADAQDGSGTNNANMSTPADGGAPRMQMYNFTGPTPDRDGDFDAVIVLHEYTHGLSNRLVGGGMGISALATRGMGEGWSDFYGIGLLSDPASDSNAVYPGGSYATLELVSGMTSNYYYGIRRYPFSTDMAKNPLTFRDIDPTQASPHIGIPLSPRFGTSNSNPSQVHNVGEVWCMALWECRANLIAKHGPAGAQMILQFVTDGMKLAPVNPNFLQARDAVIQADYVATGGLNSRALWEAFAKRGMGISATAPASSTTTGVVEAFDIPDDLSVNPPNAITASGPVGGPFTAASQIYSLTNTGAAPLTWTAAAAQPWMSVSPAGGSLAAGSATTVTMAFNPAAVALASGTYGGAVNFTNATSTTILPRGVTLSTGTGGGGLQLTMAVPDSTTESAGVLAGAGTVTLSAAQGANVVVSLTSSNPAEASVPVMVTVPAGLLSATFNVTVGDDAVIDGPQAAILTASASGFPGAAAVITVQDNDGAGTLALNAPASATEGEGTVQATLTTTVAPGAPLTVTLTSGDTSEVVVPSSVVIPVGQTSVTFPITIVNDTEIDGTQTANLTASLPGWTSGTASISVLDNENRDLALSIPATVAEGTTGTGTVSISGTLPSPLVVSLSSNTTSRLTVPPTATIAAGATSATFSLATVNNSLTDGSAAVSIGAAAGGFIGANATTTVLDNDVHHFTLSAIAATQTRAVPFSVTVTAKDVNDLTIASYTGSTGLSAAGAGGAVSISPSTTTAFTAGVWTGNVTVNTFDTNVVLTASDGAGHTGASNVFNVGIGALHRFAWNTIASPQTAGVAFSTTVRAQDLGNNTVTSFTGVASLRGFSLGAATSSIVITELNTNTPDAIEFMNVGTAAVDLSGWKIYLYDNDTGATAPKLFTIPAGTTCAAGQVFRLQEFGTSPGTFPLFNLAANINWNPTSTDIVGVLVRDAANNNVDFFCAAALAAASVTSPAAIPASQWTGAQVAAPTNTAFDYLRIGTSDGGSAADWTTNTPSMGTANSGLSVPFAPDVPVQILPNTSGSFVAGVWTGSVTTLQAATQMRLRADDGSGRTGDSNLFNSNASAAAEISVEQPALTSLTDGSATVSFGTAAVGGEANSKTFVIRNPGSLPLTITAITGDGADIASFSFPAMAGVTIPPAGSVSFSVQFAAASAGAKTAAIHIGSNDADENPFDIALTGSGVVAPEITVEQPSGTERANGSGTVGFGDSVFGAAVVKELTIRNTGAATLNLGAVTVDGPNSAEFVAAAPSVNTLAPGGTATLDVTFTPSGTGARGAALHIASNDPNENPYDVMLTGIGLAPSGVLRLARDINQTGLSPGITIANAAVIGNTLYFAANSSATGTELWKSDGTAAGTVLVRDIFPGIGSSLPANFFVIGSTLYFSANSGTTGAELWKSDGTDAGTVLVRDIFSGFTGSSPANLTNVAGTLFFTASDSTANGTELWKSDGTAGGTVLVLNINAIANTSSSPANLTAVGSTLFFTANDGVNGVELWKSNGTAAGTVLMSDINAGVASSTPANFVAVGSTLFFTATNTTNGIELWKSDGTAGGTVLVLDINAGSVSSSPAALVNAGGTLFFRATTAANGAELWKSDGTAAGTVLVMDIFVGIGNSTPSNLFVVGSGIYFAANDGTNGNELWKSDGTAAGTVLVLDINPGTSSSSPSNFVLIGDTLYFSATTAANGTELWKTRGLAANTVLVEDINPGTAGSSPGVVFNVGGFLAFVANDGANGAELWWSDGTAAGTNLIKDIILGSSNAVPTNLRALNGTLLFSANDGVNGAELWQSSGLPGGTTLLRDIFTGASSSNPGAGVVIGSTLYYSAGDSAGGTELWKTDGTFAGTVRVKDIFPGTSSSFPVNLARVGATLYFAATGATADGQELWKSDGTDPGTVLVANINPTANMSSSPANLTDVNGTLFFIANDGTNGIELWKSDGTAGGTGLVKDINVGSVSSSPSNLRAIGGTLFFTATTAANGTELWKSDGTAAGTVLVTDIYVGTNSASPNNLTVIGSTLFFSALELTNGTELWKSDGTATGTVLVKDIYPGAFSSSPANLTNINGTLFFSAFDPANGTELWKSDGTAAGTVLVKDINPGNTATGFTAFANVNAVLYFSGSTTATGAELWKSDGTAAGTVMVSDIRTGPLGSSPANLTPIGSRLFFTAIGLDLGTELWTLDLESADISIERPAGTTLIDGASTVTFANAVVGNGGQQSITFTILNTATSAQLTGFSFSIDGPAGSEFAASGLSAGTVTGGGTATFVVTFSPSATGGRAANLRVFSNDPDESPFDIALTGTGVAPNALEAWRLANFGTVAGTGNTADSADFEGDGLPNVLEWAFGTNPTSASRGALAVNGAAISARGEPITITEPDGAGGVNQFAAFARRKDYLSLGLSYTVQFTVNFSPWISSAVPPTMIAADSEMEIMTVPYPAAIDDGAAAFFRVVVAAP